MFEGFPFTLTRGLGFLVSITGVLGASVSEGVKRMYFGFNFFLELSFAGRVESKYLWKNFLDSGEKNRTFDESGLLQDIGIGDLVNFSDLISLKNSLKSSFTIQDGVNGSL